MEIILNSEVVPSEMDSYTLVWYEYIVFCGVLIASLGIGYCFRSDKNTTNEDFLMGGRKMSVIPVTLSLVCSFVSAITLLGNPVEIYFYGSQFSLVSLAFIPMTIALAYVYVPVFFDLQLISAYEYFEWRFSSSVRKLISICSMIQLLIYMPIAVWGPSLALAQVAGINPFVSAAAIFIVCIIYASAGGLKAVLWSNAMQGVVMLGSLIIVVFLGVYEVGGFETIWETAGHTDRLQFFNFDTDLRARHTFWTTIIGTFFYWLPLFAATQAQIQRYNSVPTLRDSRICVFYTMIGLIITLSLCSLVGLVIYTHYATCDPVLSKRVTSPDQLLPLFTMDVLRKYPGLPGLLVAGLTCGSLSTVSSVLNSLAAIIVEDFVKWRKPGLTEIQLGLASKIASATTGLFSFLLIFVVGFLNDVVQIQPFVSVSIAILYTPILAAFTLGMLFPWVNNRGALSGIIVSILSTGFMGISNVIAAKQGATFNQKLFLTTEGCTNSSVSISSIIDSQGVHAQNNWKGTPTDFATDFLNISYVWQGVVGFFTAMIVGLIVSAVGILMQEKFIASSEKVHKSLLSKPFLKFWRNCCGQEHLNKWIDYGPPHYKKLANIGK